MFKGNILFRTEIVHLLSHKELKNLKCTIKTILPATNKNST